MLVARFDLLLFSRVIAPGGRAWGRRYNTVVLQTVFPRRWRCAPLSELVTRLDSPGRTRRATYRPMRSPSAEPRARKQLDDRRTIGTTTDASRGWLFFDLILEEAGIPRSAGDGGCLDRAPRLPSGQQSVGVRARRRAPGAGGAPRARPAARRRVERQRHAEEAPGPHRPRQLMSTSSSIRATRASRNPIHGCSKSRSRVPARVQKRPSTSAICIRSTSSVRGPQEYARCFSTRPAYIPTSIAIACRRWPSSWIRSELGCFDVRSMIGVFFLRSSSQSAHCARRRLALR